ncbi:MAG: GGDEF domain-containing protein [Chlamydiota bacterium]|nr:GGDEF domain-containing protein [Chlamydiota bacterium]
MTPLVLTNQSCEKEIAWLRELNISEADAGFLWPKIVEHQSGIEMQLGRNVDFIVAAIDYLKSKTDKLRDVVIVDKKEYQNAWTSAYTDPLTGLYNRRYLLESLQREIEKSKRYHLSFSLIFLDLDHFKTVNDRFGHMYGDIVLQKTSELIRTAFRTSDLLARYGGEEFVILMPQTTTQMAWKVGERLRHIFQEQSPRFFSAEWEGLTLSGGVVTCPQDTDNTKAIIHFADEALYAAKREGRNRIYTYREISKILGKKKIRKNNGGVKGAYYERAS